MYKNGIVAGKFRLLHLAHREYFIQAMGEVEKLYIVITEGDFERYASLAETQQAVGKIMMRMGFKVGADYEIIVAPHTKSQDEWEDWLIANLAIKDIQDWVIFNSKEDYPNNKFNNHYLELFSVGNIDKISATALEESPYTLVNSNFICQEFLTYMNKKVVITGTESCGKTVLASKLAGVLDTEFSEEYGRYHSHLFLGDQDITFQPKDFVHIAMQQLLQDKELNEKAKRLLIVDTDPVVTLRFFYDYMERLKSLGRWSDYLEEEAQTAEAQLIKFIEGYKYDLIILLQPNVLFVEDGLRWDMDRKLRWENHERLKQLYTKYNIKFQEITSENYNNRFIETVRIIRENLLGLKPR
ncbi:MAG: AAA family ATPase [Alphaproteobacteria bacterium]